MTIKIKNVFLHKIRNIFFGNRFLSFPEYRLRKFVKMVAGYVVQNSEILDVGAGECRHKKYFVHANYVSQYLCIGDKKWDFSDVDIKSDIYNIPVSSESFKYLLCTEVLEHLKYPSLAFREFNRILKKGGRLFLVCPLTPEEHQKPYDYFRYTQFALNFLAEENGFYIEKLEKERGKFITISQLIAELIPSLLIERKMIVLGYVFKILLYPIIFPFCFISYFF